MQQTAIDRWLRKKFVYVSQVYCNTLPHSLPPGVTLEETDEETGSRYLYRMTTENERALNELTAHLEVANITYTSRIAERESLPKKLFGNPHKSFTMQVAWLFLIITILAIAFSGLPVYLWKTLSAEEEPDGEQSRMIATESAQFPV